MGDSVMVKKAFGDYDPEVVTIESVDDLRQPLTVVRQIERLRVRWKGDSEEAIFVSGYRYGGQ